MNKAITEGVQFMPPAFEDGLNVWSSGDGTPGSDTYANNANAAFVPADQDFGGCLELLKNNSTQKLRYMGQTPIEPGCYLQIKARVKAISGNLPTVRIAAWAGRSGNAALTGVPLTGPSVPLVSYGQVVEVSAIVGVGARQGVDMPWGRDARYGHFGLNLTGANGGVVRVDDIEITDVTSVFIRDMLSVVDVRDYGAIGNGSTNDAAAFTAANADADGRTILVPDGTYRLNDDVTLNGPVRFEGKVTMPTDKMLLLNKSFDLPTYIDAFENEELAFQKAFQALLNNSDHESLDMGGRKISISRPIDMSAAVPNRSSYATRRVIRNGQIEASDTSNWGTTTVTSTARYSANDEKKLTEVANVANIPVGSLVQGNGVGREVYVRSKNVATQEITLSAPLYDAVGRQNFTFRRFKYMLDFSGFSQLSKMGLADIEFQCGRRCSAIMLPPSGITFNLSRCFISRPKDRGITSIGSGCQGMLIDKCQFLSPEDALDVPDRVAIALNANEQDVKLRHNRATRFKHFAVLSGSNNVILGNHFFQGDGVSNGVRSAGLILARPYTNTNFTGNYVDNCFIEWTNEHDPTPGYSSGYSFSALNICDSVFLTTDVAPWFSFIVVKPHGTGHFVNGLSMTGNKFTSLQGNIDRVDRVDNSFASLNYSRMKDVYVQGNAFFAINEQIANPLRVTHTQSSAAQSWTINGASRLPFGGKVRGVDSVSPIGAIRNGGGAAIFSMPYAEVLQGAQDNLATLKWPQAVKGKATVTLRIDG